MKKMLRRLMPSLLLTLGALSLLTGTGCATLSDPVARIVVKAQNENTFLVDDQLVDLGQLPRALKQAGAGYESEVVVEMPPEATPEMMKQVYPTLTSAGFQKVFFAHPREATSSVKSATAPAGTTSPARTLPPTRTRTPTGPQRRK
jgi:hypothetical protein